MSEPAKNLPRRTPSASMVVALLALFTALGGVGYAASALPANSVGRSQIRNDAVNYQKIEPGSVGIARINPSTVQARVLNTCSTGHSAITAINVRGPATPPTWCWPHRTCGSQPVRPTSTRRSPAPSAPARRMPRVRPAWRPST